MGLSRKLPRSTEPTSQEALDRMMEDWPASQLERRPEQERDLPVPDADGNPVSQRQLDAAQERLLHDMEREPFDMSQSRRWAARAEPAASPTPDRERPFVSRRWSREAPEREEVTPRESVVKARRWENERDDAREAERLEPMRDPQRE